MADSEISNFPPPPLPPGKKWSTEWLKDEVLPYLHWLAGEGGDFSKGSPVYEYITDLLTKKAKMGALSGSRDFINRVRAAYEKAYGVCDPIALEECLAGIKRDIEGSESALALPYATELLEFVEEFRNMTQTERNRVYRRWTRSIPVDDSFFKRIKESPWGKEQYDCFSERPEACKKRNGDCDASAQKMREDGQKLEIPHNTAEIVNGIAINIATIMEQNQRREAVDDSERIKLAASAVYLLGCYAMSGRPSEWAPGCAMSGEKDIKASQSSDIFEIGALGWTIRSKCVKKTEQLSGSARDTNWRVLMLPLSTFSRLAACLDHEWNFLENHESAINNPEKWFINSIEFGKSLWEPLRTAVERHNGIKFTPYFLKHISVALLPHSYIHKLAPSGILELQKLQCGHYTASSTQEYLKVAVKNPEKIEKKLYIGMNKRDLLVSEALLNERSENSSIADDNEDEEDDNDERSENSSITDDSGDEEDDQPSQSASQPANQSAATHKEEEVESSFGDGSSMEEAQATSIAPTVVTTNVDEVRRQIIGYKRMRDEDLITEEEFVAKKKKLLGL